MSPSSPALPGLVAPEPFAARHIGPQPQDLPHMLAVVGAPDLDALIDEAVPAGIRTARPLDVPPAATEAEALAELWALAEENRVARPFLGLGYAGTFTPPVIQRNVLENPGWYTQYTPYQPEISQGRLEALLNFQTAVIDLTGMDIANASMLDEATAAAEAMTLCHRVLAHHEGRRFLVDAGCHPQTIAVMRTRAEPLGIAIEVGDPDRFELGPEVFGILVQYPATDGAVRDPSAAIARAHDAGALAVVATDLLALTLLRPPGAMGADVVVGNAQRFGVPLGFGGPHAAFMATRDEHKRQLPGRLVGVSRDATGAPALRLALQTREQHIRRDRATSNICTAQVLLAVMASMYAVYHGPDGLRRIARSVRRQALALRDALAAIGCDAGAHPFFDTLAVRPARAAAADVVGAARARGILLRALADGRVVVALDETTTARDLAAIYGAFGGDEADFDAGRLAAALDESLPASLERVEPFLEHPVFNSHRSETEMLRYIRRLEARDLSLTTSMIPLGSCTMKLNATAEMVPVSWPGFAALHPFAPAADSVGYRELFDRLERWLADITGFAAVSLQPNAGSQGELAGLLVLRAWHRHRGESHRDVCLIPTSAHGTNPASAVMAGMRVVAVRCDDDGNIDVGDLRARAAEHRDRLAALMVTYPSTHGVFEATIREIAAIVHEAGGQVYLDGANLNALVGLCRPGEFGADVCHLNLHKTFCIPHGGGGPGMGPIGVAEHLAPFLPGHPLEPSVGGTSAIGPVSAAPWGSPSILPIAYAYIRMMGPDGLRRASEMAILAANYVARRLAPHYPVLYTGAAGRVAHECILDLRPMKEATGVDVEDVAKRLMDYGFHAPTMSWPVAGTLMIEPTESEPLAELDRFCDAMIAIRAEARAIEEGRLDREDNPLRNAPHTARAVCGDAWDRGYGREQAAFPAPWLRDHKFWPSVARIDNAYGDRHVVCACPPVEAFAEG